MAIGSIELIKTYDRFVAHDDSVATNLLRISIDLEHQRISPQGPIAELMTKINRNPLPFWVLRDFVLDHIHMFPVDRAVRQYASDKLQIEWRVAQKAIGDVSGKAAHGDSGKKKPKKKLRKKPKQKLRRKPKKK